MEELCELFGRSKQAFYQGEKRQKDRLFEDEIIIQEVLKIRASLPKLGCRKLQLLLVDPLSHHGISCGRDHLFSLLREHDLLIKQRKRRKVQTTFSEHGRPIYQNLVKDFVPDGPHQVWFCDITYIRTGDGYGYLSLITDGYSRKVVGFGFRLDLSTEGCLAALQMAQEQWPATVKLIHHSDRGSQYASKAYLEQLVLEKQETNKLVEISMSRKRSPQDNPIGERINGIMKNESMLHNRSLPFDQVAENVKKAVKSYNFLRPHSSCDMFTPDQAHQKKGILKKRWKHGTSQVEHKAPIS